ncbi:MAG: hypothetical protein VX265_14740, partial [Myxococcota bacterium]|nr:hypothetical protein [Myxococcota bacterium]
FWKGPNKYGPGERLGLRGDDGETHWIDSASVEPTDAAVPEGPTFERGDRIRFRLQGREGSGTVFWTGQNRHGPGQRLGVNPDDGDGRDDAVWLDARAAQPLPPEEDERGAEPRGGSARGNPYGGDDTRSAGREGDGWRSEEPEPIPHEYQGNVGLDDMPPAAPWDDGAADAMAAGADAADGPPPPEW